MSSAIDANTDYDLIPVPDIELLAGSNFPKKLNDDTAAFIINVSAVEAMGETISGVIGKPILCNEMPGLVTGVVKNFHFKPLKSGIEPFICGYQPKSGYSNMFVKTHEGDSEKLIRQMENVYNQFEPDIPFRFTILRDALEKSYTEEKRIASVIMFFAVLTIFIGCFGLCGLTLYSSERRIKEIGIRKVLGAGITSIATTLTKDFMLLVSLGILIAIPVAWMLINSWLKQYAYRTEIEWWVFVIVAMMVLLIACITVGLQSLATAKMNPIRVLRCE